MPDVTPKYSPDYLPVAVERPTPMVLVGTWGLLVPPATIGPLMVFAVLPEPFWLTVPVFAFIEVLCLGGLFVVTRNFLRYRRARMRSGTSANSRGRGSA